MGQNPEHPEKAWGPTCLGSPIPWERGLLYKFERKRDRLPCEEDIREPDYTRCTVRIPSATKGDTLEAWLYEPVLKDTKGPPPVIIMSHGMGFQKDIGIPVYATLFAKAGFAAVTFDYRSYGGSDGEPRHVVSVKRHIEDVESVLDFVAAGSLGTGRVDVTKIALWGYCYSGGHMMCVAAKARHQDKVKALIACAPFLTGKRNVKQTKKGRGRSVLARLVTVGVIDKLRGCLGLSPVYIPIVGPPGTLALTNLPPEVLATVKAFSPDAPAYIGGWKPYASARCIVQQFTYKPIEKVHKIKCPTLLVAATNDMVTPMSLIHEAKNKIGDRCQVIEHGVGHFELYHKIAAPEAFNQLADFLRVHLDLARPKDSKAVLPDSGFPGQTGDSTGVVKLKDAAKLSDGGSSRSSGDDVTNSHIPVATQTHMVACVVR